MTIRLIIIKYVVLKSRISVQQVCCTYKHYLQFIILKAIILLWNLYTDIYSNRKLCHFSTYSIADCGELNRLNVNNDIPESSKSN